uniref:Ribonuclease A-domain domain-containing protein n=1 Tax=Kryptolebias marmoratus TaxID=37003 RepID=A0A3Q3EQT8_KRYMA
MESPQKLNRRQHVDPDMTVKKCDSEMKRKKIYCPDNSCKETNTFILASPNKVKSICQGQGNFDKNSQLTSSKEKFKIVVCKLKKSARKPKCQYKGSLLKNKVVVVRCDKRLPVHYDHHSQIASV